MLTKAGYQMSLANNGKEAVEKFTAEPERYDLIFMDLHMPELDGLEATKVLRHRGVQGYPDHRHDGRRHEGRQGSLPGRRDE